MIHQHQIKSEDGTVYYWKYGGQGEGLVFTHGALMDHGLFDEQIDFFKSHFTVIVWDVPAHGMSRPYPQFSLSKATEELMRILEREGLKEVHLVGQSMGGYIAQLAARDYPDRVKSVTTIGSSPIQARYYSSIDDWLLKITPLLLRMYPYQSLIKAIAKQISSLEKGRSYALSTLKQYSKTEIADVMREVYLGVQDYRNDEILDVPMLITYGQEDKTGKVQAYCNEWAKLEQLPLEVIPQAAHNANLDNPSFFNEVLKKFLTETLRK